MVGINLFSSETGFVLCMELKSLAVFLFVGLGTVMRGIWSGFSELEVAVSLLLLSGSMGSNVGVVGVCTLEPNAGDVGLILGLIFPVESDTPSPLGLLLVLGTSPFYCC